ADYVPIAVLRMGRIDERCLIRRVDLRLVRRIPVAARQPKRLAVFHGDLDVIGGRKRFCRSFAAEPRERPGKAEPFLESGSQLVVRGFDGLLPFVWRLGGRVEGQGKLVGTAKSLNKGTLDVRRRELVQADDEILRNTAKKFLQLRPPLLGANVQDERHLCGDGVEGHPWRRYIVDVRLAHRCCQSGERWLRWLE